jgi:anti-sigma factor RsiW
MFCDQVLERIEAIAAGEEAPDQAFSAHVASCTGCRRALADARELDRLLRARPAPRPSPQFTTRVMVSVRRERWRSDQTIDVLFNGALVLVGFGLFAGGWALLAWSGLIGGPLTAGNLTSFVEAFTIVSEGARSLGQDVTASLPLYLASGALIAMALGVWWWAERPTNGLG